MEEYREGIYHFNLRKGEQLFVPYSFLASEQRNGLFKIRFNPELISKPEKYIDANSKSIETSEVIDIPVSLLKQLSTILIIKGKKEAVDFARKIAWVARESVQEDTDFEDIWNNYTGEAVEEVVTFIGKGLGNYEYVWRFPNYVFGFYNQVQARIVFDAECNTPVEERLFRGKTLERMLKDGKIKTALFSENSTSRLINSIGEGRFESARAEAKLLLSCAIDIYEGRKNYDLAISSGVKDAEERAQVENDEDDDWDDDDEEDNDLNIPEKFDLGIDDKDFDTGLDEGWRESQ